jgi:hypothetical protein
VRIVYGIGLAPHLDAFLGLRLGLEDLRACYDKPLYRNSRGIRDLLLASAIHGKNYFGRIDEARLAQRKPECLNG